MPVNKSEEIRKALAALPNASNREVMTYLLNKRVKVLSSDISKQKYELRARAAKAGPPVTAADGKGVAFLDELAAAASAANALPVPVPKGWAAASKELDRLASNPDGKAQPFALPPAQALTVNEIIRLVRLLLKLTGNKEELKQLVDEL